MNTNLPQHLLAQWLVLQEPFLSWGSHFLPSVQRSLSAEDQAAVRRNWQLAGGPVTGFGLSAYELEPRLGELSGLLGLQAAGLEPLRAAVVAAIRQGSSEMLQRAAWTAYLDALNDRIDAAPKDLQARLRAALFLLRAEIWHEAEEPVEWLRSLNDARHNLADLRLPGYLVMVSTVLIAHLATGESYQSRDEWDEAIDVYLAQELSAVLSDRRRGEISLRLAECYAGGRPVTREALGDLWELYWMSLENARFYLEGTSLEPRADARLAERPEKGE